MCKQRAILEMRKKTKPTGIGEFQISLAESQAEDFEQMHNEIKGIKRELESVKQEQVSINAHVGSINDKLDFLIEQSKRTPLTNAVLALFENTWFWFWFMLATALMFGASLSDLGNIIKGVVQ